MYSDPVFRQFIINFFYGEHNNSGHNAHWLLAGLSCCCFGSCPNIGKWLYFLHCNLLNIMHPVHTWIEVHRPLVYTPRKTWTRATSKNMREASPRWPCTWNWIPHMGNKRRTLGKHNTISWSVASKYLHLSPTFTSFVLIVCSYYRAQHPSAFHALPALSDSELGQYHPHILPIPLVPGKVDSDLVNDGEGDDDAAGIQAP